MNEIFTVLLPDIGEGVVEGEVIEWLKQEGESLEKDEPVVVVMTDKATVELPAPYQGTLAKQHHHPGEIAIRDRPLYDIVLADGVTVAKKEQRRAAATTPTPETTPAPKQRGAPSHPGASGKVLATPAVRHLAKKIGIDLATIEGSGTGGRILAEDLRGTGPATRSGRAAPPIAQSSPIVSLEGDVSTPLSGFRRLTAEKMVEAKYIIPHFSYFDQVDATRLLQLRESFKKAAVKENIKITFMPFFIRALSLALLEFPQVNASIDLGSNSIVTHTQHNVGVAMSGPNGLVVPVLKGVQKMSLEQVIRAFDALKKKALNNEVDSCDMREATISISNFGALGKGGVFATPIIHYPEAAILGVAKIRKQPVICNGAVVARDILNLSWSFDHRLVDGDSAASMSQAFTDRIANPSKLL